MATLPQPLDGGTIMAMDNNGATLTTQDAYTAHLKARALRPATIRCYTGWVRRLQEWLGRPLEAATVEDLEQWVGSHDWSPNSHQKAVQAVKYYYRWMHATGRIPADPAHTLKPARSPRPISRPCPDNVYEQALARASGDAYWRLRLAGETGLRRAELAAVHSDDVQQLLGGPNLHVVGKGGVQRWVPLPDDLAAWISMQHGWVFPNRSGGHLTADGVGHWYARRLGWNTHSLRHRYAGHTYHAGRDIESVRDLLGHASVATTQHYLTTSPEALRSAAAGAWLKTA